LKSHGRKYVELVADPDPGVAGEVAPDPVVVRAALTCFLSLPVTERSAVILKDVLGHSLEETAETMGVSVMAVKSALLRGRGKLQQQAREEAKSAPSRAALERYASLFNARDWDGVRALVADDCRLDLVSKSQRRGKEVGAYFARYEKESLSARVARVDGQLALAVYATASPKPAYFILLEFADGRVQTIRDFRYVP